MIANRWVSLYAPLAALALLAGCTSTDLNQHRYSPPQVRMPGQQAATQPASDVRVSPVGSVPVQPLPQADDCRAAHAQPRQRAAGHGLQPPNAPAALEDELVRAGGHHHRRAISQPGWRRANSAGSNDLAWPVWRHV